MGHGRASSLLGAIHVSHRSPSRLAKVADKPRRERERDSERMGEVTEVAAGAAAASAISRGLGNFNFKSKPIKWRNQTATKMMGHWQLKTPMVRMRSRPHYCSSIPATSSTASPQSPGDDYDGKGPRADRVTFSSSEATDVPLYEPPGVSFDEYLRDRPRIFRAMFPDKRRSQRLNDEEWQIQMLPLQFLFASVRPVVVMRLRCKSHGQGYPPPVPLHVTRVLELQATRWELQGLDALHMPSDFSLSVQGLLYSERKNGSRQSRLKGHLELSINLVLPTLLALVPEDVLRGTAELVLKRLVKRMKEEVNGGLISDFRSFGRERLKHGQAVLSNSSTVPIDQ